MVKPHLYVYNCNLATSVPRHGGCMQGMCYVRLGNLGSYGASLSLAETKVCKGRSFVESTQIWVKIGLHCLASHGESGL